jgi:hypothetical protein
MALKREDALKTITDGLAWVVAQCRLSGFVHLLDSHIVSHEFFSRVLNEIYDLQLVVLDREAMNFPGVDLGDEVNGRCFQITSDKRGEKIQHTLDMYVKHQLNIRFGKLQVLVIGDKQTTYNSLSLPPGLSFRWPEDVVDISDLMHIIDGLDTERLERIARIVQQEVKVARPPVGLQLHTTVFNAQDRQWPWGEETRLTYASQSTEDTLFINACLPYLERVRSGGPIEPLRYITSTYGPFDWEFPALDFRFQNRGAVSVYITEAVLHIETSSIDPSPIIALKKDVFQSNAGAITIVNEGATELENVTVRYTVIPGRVPASAAVWGNYGHEVAVGTVVDRVDVRVEDGFCSAGLDIAGLDALHANIENNGHELIIRSESGTERSMSFQEHAEAVKGCLGPFVEEIGTAVGEIEFSTRTSTGVVRQTKVRFCAPVHIFNEHRRGLPKPPSYTYHAELEAGRNNYQRVVSLSHEIKPDETDRFIMKLLVRQPSHHRLRIAFRSVDGLTVQSPWIELRCFVPRRHPVRFAEATPDFEPWPGPRS